MGALTRSLDRIKEEAKVINREVLEIAAQASNMEESVKEGNLQDIINRINGVNAKVKEIMALCEEIVNEVERGKDEGKSVKKDIEEKV